MDDDPARRRRLPVPGGQPPRTPAAAAAADPSSHRRFSPMPVLPPVHPAATRFVSPVPGAGYYYNVPPAPVPTAGGGGGGWSHHARSLSMDTLARPSYADLAAQAAIPFSSSSGGRGASGPGLPPLRAGHRRSQSDALLVFSQASLQMPPPAPVNPEAPAAEGRESVSNNTLDGILGSYASPKGLPGAGSSMDLASQVRGLRTLSAADRTESKVESVDGSMPRHCRSLSADSFIGKLAFEAAGQEASNLSPKSPGSGAAVGLARSGSGSIDGTEFAGGGFTEAEKKKIVANERLMQIVSTDPRRVKRILNNRLSAAKSKERKVRYMSELERKVQVLQVEATTLSAQVTMTQRDNDALSIQNNEMKIRLHAMEQQAQLKDALNDALTSEIQRLKLVAGEISDFHMPNGSHQRMYSQMLQLQQLQILKQPSQAQQEERQQ